MTVRRIYDRLATEDAYQLGVKVPKVADIVRSWPSCTAWQQREEGT